MSIRSIDQLVDVVLQLLGMGYLFPRILFLKDTVEIRNNMPIYVVNPYSTIGAESGIFTREEGNTGVKFFEIFEQHSALVAAPIAVSQGWHEPPRIDC